MTTLLNTTIRSTASSKTTPTPNATKTEIKEATKQGPTDSTILRTKVKVKVHTTKLQSSNNNHNNVSIKNKTPDKDGNIIIIVVAAVLTVLTIGIAWLYLRKKL